MRIGIISEGYSDRAVITNILKGLIQIDDADIQPLRPVYNYDATTLAVKPIELISSWTVVREECIKRTKITEFLAIAGQDFVVIHIDAAEAENYGVVRPAKGQNTEEYAVQLRANIVNKVNEWLENNHTEEILYAIAIEETDAWVLTIFDKKDSIKSAKPKEKLQSILGDKDLSTRVDFDNYYSITKVFAKRKEWEKNKYQSYNHSLKLFADEVIQKVL